ncbi:MAG: ATP-binding protein [Isosphaeraceae bacterium]
MTSLDSYLRGPHREDLAFLNRLTKTIEEVLPVFYKCKDKLPLSDDPTTRVESWCYAIWDKQTADDGSSGMSSFSASTHSMILFALDALRLRGQDKYSLLLGSGFRPGKIPDTIRARLWEVIDASKNVLVNVITGKEQPIVMSSTYGGNDPFTLTWLTELAFRSEAGEFDRCKKEICEAVDVVLSDARWKQILDTSKVEGAFSQVTGSFLKVRRLHLARAIERLAAEAKLPSRAKAWLEKPEHWQDFDTTLHRQLAYSAVGDAKFDPAELAFAFEGALLLHPLWISHSTVDQVFEALKLSRERQPLWRPITPFLTNDRGQVLFLVSIEVANSILRACEILDKDDPVPTRFSRFEPHLRTYATWLLGEKEQFPAPAEYGGDGKDGGKLVGWHSEYSEKRGTIHLWYTSHVLLFLVHYSNLLRRKIAADGIEAAGLHLRLPTSIKLFKDYWTDEPLPALATIGRKHYAVHDTIEKQYIQPRKGGEKVSKAPRSMLLYGPPGTGKTTVAEQMAVRLKRPLIVVTVSDFLAAGAAELENRAKGVFDVLRNQEDVIILFDEIDQFLLDRNSDFYQEQDDVFKFMTPGMLTKLQDLRDAEGCIFIVATNYYERIDSAIKRRGRIDEHFLLCLPDRQRREALLKRFACDLLGDGLESKETKEKYLKAAKLDKWELKFDDTMSKEEKGKQKRAALEGALKKFESDFAVIASKTTFYGYGDLKNLVESRTMTKIQADHDAPNFADAMGAAREEVDSAVNLSAYRNRFKGEDQPPFEEFFLLLYLLAESKETLDNDDKETIYLALDRIPGFQGDNLTFLLNQKSIKENAICDKLNSYLSTCFSEWKERKRRNEEAELRKQARDQQGAAPRTTASAAS